MRNQEARWRIFVLRALKCACVRENPKYASISLHITDPDALRVFKPNTASDCCWPFTWNEWKLKNNHLKVKCHWTLGLWMNLLNRKPHIFLCYFWAIEQMLDVKHQKHVQKNSFSQRKWPSSQLKLVKCASFTKNTLQMEPEMDTYAQTHLQKLLFSLSLPFNTCHADLCSKTFIKHDIFQEGGLHFPLHWLAFSLFESNKNEKNASNTPA